MITFIVTIESQRTGVDSQVKIFKTEKEALLLIESLVSNQELAVKDVIQFNTNKLRATRLVPKLDSNFKLQLLEEVTDFQPIPLD